MPPVKFYSERFSRRTFLRIAGISVCADASIAQQQPSISPGATTEAISPEDDQFLEELEKANFLFFLEQTEPETGLVKDRCNVRAVDNSIVASIAATGFGLTALCIGHQRGYVSTTEAHKRVFTALHFLWEKMP